MIEPGDEIPTRAIFVGSIGDKRAEDHPFCTVCGVDVTDFRFEFWGFVGEYRIQMILQSACRDHWQAPLEERLKAAA